MGEREWSIADRFIYAAHEVSQIDADVDNDNPHRYTIRKMKQTADKIMFDAITAAQDIAFTARELKREMREIDAKNLSPNDPVTY